jgi:Mor family transcriptional regulator
MLFKSRAEKVDYVIRLYEQGKTRREIAKEVHMSFGNIAAIIRRVEGDHTNEGRENHEENNISQAAQALKLFSEGEKPLEVAIKLDLGAQEVDRLYKEFWHLKGLYKLTSLYDEIGDLLPSFLELFTIMKNEGMMNQKGIGVLLKSANDLPFIENRIQKLTEEVNLLGYQKHTSRVDLFNLREQISRLKDYADSCRSYTNTITEILSNKENNLANLNQIIESIYKSEGYQKIGKIAEERVSATLKDKNAILLAACMAMLEALKNDPNKQQLLDHHDYFTSDSGSHLFATTIVANFEAYLQTYHQEMLELANKLYDRLVIVCVKDTISAAIDGTKRD